MRGTRTCLLEFLDIGFFVNGCVGRGLVPEHLRHLDGFHAFLEHALAFNNEIVREFQSVHMHIPIHPLAGLDHGLLFGSLVRFADLLRVLFQKLILLERAA